MNGNGGLEIVVNKTTKSDGYHYKLNWSKKRGFTDPLL